jgi:hypothetical protein
LRQRYAFGNKTGESTREKNHSSKRFRPHLETFEDRLLLASGAAESLVNQLYQDLLGRSADQGGLTLFANVIDQGGSRGAVASQLMGSSEYLTNQVQLLYTNFLNRSADSAGLSHFVAFLQSGGTFEEAAAEMASSAEYLQTRAGGNYDSFLDSLFHDALGRGLDAAGREAFRQSRANGATSAQVAAAVFGSAEHDQNLVQNDFEELLRRPPDSTGLNALVAALQQGATDQQVTAAIVSSDEYFNLYQPYVTQVYQDLLRRQPDSAGLNFWTGFLDQGNSRTAMVQQFTHSQEYQTLQVQQAFETLLVRHADRNGLATFVAQLQNGDTVAQVQAQLAASQEYFQNRGGGSNDGFLDALYHDALNRVVDSAARSALDQALQNGLPRVQVALTLYTSAEYQQDLVANLFQQFLGRAPDSTGLGTFVNLLEQGVPVEQVVAALVGSAEYYVSLNDNLLQGEVDFTGPYPNPANVSFTDNTGTQVQVVAFPGEVEVFFDPLTSQPEAAAAIQVNGGSIIGQLPRVGEYLVSVPDGHEGAFITNIGRDVRVEYAGPAGISTIASASATVIDFFTGAAQPACDGMAAGQHGEQVEQILANGGNLSPHVDLFLPFLKNTVSQELMGLPASPYRAAAQAIDAQVNDNQVSPTLLNLSFQGLLPPGADPDFMSPLNDTAHKRDMQANEYAFLNEILSTIAALPVTARQNFVITISAGNHNIPLQPLLKGLRHNPRLADVLKNNVLLVTSDKFASDIQGAPNRAPGDPDLAVMTNPESVCGTSFAAPAALAIIQQVIAQTGVTANEALRAVKQAVAANGSHQLVLAEAVHRAGDIAAAMSDLSVRPASISLSAEVGRGGRPEQPLIVTNTGKPGSSLRYTIQSDNPRVTVGGPVTPIPAGESNMYEVAFDATGLPVGVYHATITFASINRTVMVPVTLTVRATPTISVQPSELLFTAPQGGPNPSAQSFRVTNTGPAGSELNPTIGKDAGWISTSGPSGSIGSGAYNTYQVAVNVAGLAAGAYQGTITVSDPDATIVSQTIDVSLLVAPLTYTGGFSGFVDNNSSDSADPGDPFHDSNYGGPGTVTVTANPTGGFDITLSANVNQSFETSESFSIGSFQKQWHVAQLSTASLMFDQPMNDHVYMHATGTFSASGKTFQGTWNMVQTLSNDTSDSGSGKFMFSL